MMRIFPLVLLLFSTQIFYGQADDISQQEVERILGFLASDSLKGRGNETMDLRKAAYFIENEFRNDSLDFFQGYNSYLQPFSLYKFSKKEKQKDSLNGFLSPKILFNVIGVLPGNKLPDEAIVFSAHYDHLGTAGSGRDIIFNGANDDASGTTALLMLAHYFSKKKDNARTLIFCAFAGEELGLLGSQAFVENINCKTIVAAVNIEMIGVTNVSGKNAFFITGADFSDFNKIVKKNLKGTGYRVVAEPDERKELFKRSDNYSFARLGVPAHTVMCSDDEEPCYHKVCDEMKRIDVPNMVGITKAIAIATLSLVNGTDTPGRIKGIY
jgi:Zn-dependent M28 family amino/carboxypeptidase